MSLRVQFGSGTNQLEGWQNLELHNGDITKPLQFSDNSVDEVLCEHCAEHVSGPNMFRFLLEARRILKSGGILHISMPVIDDLEPDHAREIILLHGHEVPWTRNSMLSVCSLAGFSDVDRDRDESRKDNFLRPEIYGHWRAIGEEKDEIESFRLKLTK